MLVVATAQCVYGLAQEHPEALVIFVSNSQPLLKRLASVGTANLCGITGAMLLNWARKGERPPAATQQLQTLMRTLTERKSAQRSNSRIQDAAVGKTGASASKLTGTPGTSDLKSSSSFTKTNKTGLTQKRRASSRPKTPPLERLRAGCISQDTYYTSEKKEQRFSVCCVQFFGSVIFLDGSGGYFVASVRC
jgi:hypothetical protein